MLIKNISIKNSKFFGGGLELNLNDKLNCFMGGRGSGKTSVLSLVHWALNDDSDLSKEILTLVKTNLGAGTVEVTLELKNGSLITASKNWDNSPFFVDHSGKSVDDLHIEQIRKAIFFPAGQIERIGLDPTDRLRLFDRFMGSEFKGIQNAIYGQVNQLKQNQLSLISRRTESKKLAEDLMVFSNVEKELTDIKIQLGSENLESQLRPQFEEESKKQALRSKELAYLNSVQTNNEQIVLAIKTLKERFQRFNKDFKLPDGVDDKMIQSFHLEYLGNTDECLQALIGYENKFNGMAKRIAELAIQTKHRHQDAELNFSKLQNELSQSNALYLKYNQLNQALNKRNIIYEQWKNFESEIDGLANARVGMIDKLLNLISERHAMRASVAEKINASLGEQVKIVFRREGLKNEFEVLVRSALSDSKMRYIGADARILEYLSPMEILKTRDPEFLDLYVQMYDLNRERLSDLVKGLSEKHIFEFETFICEDFPEFLLKVDSEEGVESYRPTESLSTGQRCTAILPIVFLVSEDPLLIDQPEDNLDNKFITGHIHNLIREIKDRRQLIFVTHNPNIPVLSEAEHNVFLRYDSKTSGIVGQGTTENVKDKIVELLEGGAEAFNKRKLFYGY